MIDNENHLDSKTEVSKVGNIRRTIKEGIFNIDENNFGTILVHP